MFKHRLTEEDRGEEERRRSRALRGVDLRKKME